MNNDRMVKCPKCSGLALLSTMKLVKVGTEPAGRGKWRPKWSHRCPKCRGQ